MAIASGSPIRAIQLFFIVIFAGFLASCDDGNAGPDPTIVAPSVDDVWAADLHHFSAYTFGDFDADRPAWGLLKVVAVEAETVTVITTIEADGGPSRAREWLRGDIAALEFDESERIPVQRSELLDLLSAGHIVATRRP